MAVLPLLKTATASHHAAVEERVDVRSALASRERYVQLLQTFLALYANLEKRLEKAIDWNAHGWPFEARRKTPWLRADLQALGAAEAETDPHGNAPAYPTCAAAIGGLYVLEGATLGGQVITRWVQEHLGLTPTTGGRFFHGYGADTGRHWREFGAWAESVVGDDSAAAEQAVAGARSTFDAFAHAFSR